MSKPSSTITLCPENAPPNGGSGAVGCIPAADLVAMAGNKPAWSERGVYVNSHRIPGRAHTLWLAERGETQMEKYMAGN